jgi:hypothetical protein
MYKMRQVHVPVALVTTAANRKIAMAPSDAVWAPAAAGAASTGTTISTSIYKRVNNFRGSFM